MGAEKDPRAGAAVAGRDRGRGLRLPVCRSRNAVVWLFERCCPINIGRNPRRRTKAGKTVNREIA